MHVWTVGHSTRTAEEFIAVLGAYGVETVADVRRFPGSRRYPHFAAEALAALLRSRALEYVWLRKLGGRRRPTGSPTASAWRNPSFQAYADYMLSEEFAEGLHELLHVAAGSRTAVMCSELLWWRCHRSLIADVLLFNGTQVTHILTASKSAEHPYTSPARIVDGQLTYAAGEDQASGI